MASRLRRWDSCRGVPGGRARIEWWSDAGRVAAERLRPNAQGAIPKETSNGTKCDVRCHGSTTPGSFDRTGIADNPQQAVRIDSPRQSGLGDADLAVRRHVVQGKVAGCEIQG